MHELVFMPKASADIEWWVQNDLKGLKKIHALLDNCCNTPSEGPGQPEGLELILNTG